MSISFVTLGTTAGLLLLATLPAAAQTPDSAATRTRPKGTLIKLGTGIVPPGLEVSGYRGISVPVVVSIEHYLSSQVSVYANGFSGFKLGSSRFIEYQKAGFGYYGFDAGIRYYYNQEKRRRKGRASGPFVGNYVALQTSSVFRASSYSDYRYSGLTAVWGMQRRLGKYGWLDAYAGAGIGRFAQKYYITDFTGTQYGILPELGIKFSLGSRLTH
ncbi:hypothetical protein [Hymenobacter norwichensis]|uniref:hypothetical protein n=1 Tax=Hymenobacter norwichensis TaxID=223903 RepID=UPI0012FAD4E8|nr:hypothetical protein [Hymenobacter norwichensis]